MKQGAFQLLTLCTADIVLSFAAAHGHGTTMEPVYPLPDNFRVWREGHPDDDDARDIAPHGPPALTLEDGREAEAQTGLVSTAAPSITKPVHQLYSPTKEEIESHPIRQRLSLSRDQISSGLGTALPTCEEGYIASTEDLRQASEGCSKRRLPDEGDMADTTEPQKGDEGVYMRFRFL
jgi:hypothetical protein